MLPQTPRKPERPVLWIIAGPNGCGKSSLYNRSDIEGWGGSVWIINPDLLTQHIVEHEALALLDANLAAVQRIETWLHGSLDVYQTIGVETGLSSDKYRRLLTEAQAREEYGDDVDAAAAGYAKELAKAFGEDVPVFDVSLLGIGEDAHVASLFPGRDEQFATAACVSVRDSPKPPPTRTTFNMATIQSSREVWLIASGAGKADAIKLATGGLSPKEAPAGAARRRATAVPRDLGWCGWRLAVAGCA